MTTPYTPTEADWAELCAYQDTLQPEQQEPTPDLPYWEQEWYKELRAHNQEIRDKFDEEF